MAPAILDQGLDANRKVADGPLHFRLADLVGNMTCKELDLCMVLRLPCTNELPESMPKPIVQGCAIRTVRWPDQLFSERDEPIVEGCPEIVSCDCCGMRCCSILLVPTSVEESAESTLQFRHKLLLQEVFVADSSESCPATIRAVDLVDEIGPDHACLGEQSYNYVHRCWPL